MKKLAFAALIATTLSGCIMPTKQPPEESVVITPSDRIYLFQEPFENSAQVKVTRDIGFLGGGCFLGLLINGQLAAKLDPGERVIFYLPAGEHLLAPTWVDGRGLCGAFYTEQRAASQRRSHEIYLKEGVKKSYRIHINTDGESTVEPTE